MKISGIYKIINKIDQHFYIGSSDNIKKRWSVHKSKLRKNKHENNHLQNAVNKYNLNNFILEVFEIIEDNLQMLNEEQRLLTTHVGTKECYNINKNVTLLLGENNPFFGKTHTEESKKKMSKSKKENYSGKNHPQYGIPKSTETKKNISNARKGQFKGYAHPSLDKNIHTFSNGTETFIGIQYDFCMKYNLHKGNVSWMIKRKYKSVKGWQLVQ